MKAPEKSLPAEMAASSNAAAPEIEISNMSVESLVQDSAPSKQPPQQSAESSGAFGAAVWATDKRVNGLYTTFNARNSWMSIAGTGWVKLGTATDSGNEAMTICASHARLKNCRIDYAVDGDVVTEVYIW